MVKPIEIKRIQAEKEYDFLWNAFLQIFAGVNYKELTDNQMTAVLAFSYDSEVQNGGHTQYFENQYITFKEALPHLILATKDALKNLGANEQAEIFTQASEEYVSKLRKHPLTVEEFCDLELEGEFGGFDDRYYSYKPDMNYYLRKFISAHSNEFVKIV